LSSILDLVMFTWMTVFSGTLFAIVKKTGLLAEAEEKSAARRSIATVGIGDGPGSGLRVVGLGILLFGACEGGALR